MPDRLIRLGHSPDPDDAFMFYALAEELIPTDGFRFEHVLRDIETLNDWATRGAARGDRAVGARLRLPRPTRYRLLPHGASMGERYGPMVVAREAHRPGRAAPRCGWPIPGLLTSAFLELQLAVGRIADPVIVPFDRILDVVEAGEVDAGLVIHEGQLTYADPGPAIDPRPGRVVARADRRPAAAAGRQRRAPRPGRGRHHAPPVAPAAREHRLRPGAPRRRRWRTPSSSGAASTAALADRFVGMYVNDRTLDYGEDGRAAVAELLRRGHEAGLIDRGAGRGLRGGLTGPERTRATGRPRSTAGRSASGRSTTRPSRSRPPCARAGPPEARAAPAPTRRRPTPARHRVLDRADRRAPGWTWCGSTARRAPAASAASYCGRPTR